MAKDADKKKPGPDPDHLKLEGDWEDAVKKALEKKRPKDGWPDPPADRDIDQDDNGSE
jgi:hypothetical protein